MNKTSVFNPLKSFCVALVTLTLGIATVTIPAASAAPDRMASASQPIDRAKILSAPNVFGLVATFKIRPEWNHIRESERRRATAETLNVMRRFQDQVLVDTYLTRGLQTSSDFFLRLHAYEMTQIQDFLVAFRANGIGRYCDADQTFYGITKALNYITKEQSPDLNKGLSSATYTGPAPRYAIVIPTQKDAAWWNMTQDSRRKEMETHTLPTLPYLVSVKRKLYHATGLTDADFITYFETNDLKAFNELVIALVSIPEHQHNKRLGSPTVLGTIQTPDALMNILAR